MINQNFNKYRTVEIEDPNNKKRIILIVLFIVIGIGIIGISIYFSLTSIFQYNHIDISVSSNLSIIAESSMKNVSVTEAEISYLEGQIQYKNKNNWVDANINTILKQGDSLKLIGIGKVEMYLGKIAIIKLSDNSQIELTKLSSDSIEINLVSGDIFTQVYAQNKTFIITNNNYKYSSIGTVFRIYATTSKTGISVFESKVNIIPGNILISSSQEYYFVNKEDNKNIKKILNIDKTKLSSDKFLMWCRDKSIDSSIKILGILNDFISPEIKNLLPQDNSNIQEINTKIIGDTESDAKVIINGKEIKNTNGHFEQDIILMENQLNVIIIEVTDKAGNITTKNLNLYQGQAKFNTINYKVLKGDLVLTVTKNNNKADITWTPISSTIGNFKAYYVIIGKQTNTDPYYGDLKVGTQSYPIYTVTTNTFQYTFDTFETFNFRICASIRNNFSSSDLYCSEKIVTTSYP